MNNSSLAFRTFIDENLRPFLLKADQNAEFCNDLIKSLLKIKSIPSGEDIKTLFGVSVPVAFTMCQHLAAIERLQNTTDWKVKNEAVLKSIEKAETLVGLGTTHLASPLGNLLEGKIEANHISVNGKIPWASGQQLFDKLVIGFRTEEELIFALIDFPKTETPHHKIFPHELTIMNSTNSVALELKDLKIDKKDIISRRELTAPAKPWPTQYWHSEIGIAKECFYKIEEWLKNTQHPKSKNVEIALKELKNQVDAIEKIEKNLPSEDDNNQTTMQIQNLINNSLRLLILARGSSILKNGFDILLLQSQSNLLDLWIQSPDLINAKIRSLRD